MKQRLALFFKSFKEKMGESVSAVTPIVVIVVLLAVTFVPLPATSIILFLFGAVMLLVGMSMFTLGVDMSMIPMGDGIGASMGAAKNKTLPILLCLVLGVLITIAEPDLTVLAEQIPSIPKMTIIVSVAVGVGLFLAFALLRTMFKLHLSYILIFFYLIAALLACFCPSKFIPAAFDSGGVTTGPITVPFLMALGIGLASVNKKGGRSDSFGMVAMCSVGPIISMLILGIVYKGVEINPAPAVIPEITTAHDALMEFIHALPTYFGEVALALTPIAAVFFVFELITKRFKKHQLIRIISGFIYTYIGLVLFLCGVNVGFMPVGNQLGSTLANSGNLRWLLIPVGMLVGYFIVAAEPAVHVLKDQVEEVSKGAISKRSMGISLSVGVAASVGISMLRILTGISLLWFLIPGYVIALGMSFFVSQMFTAVAFDAGGVASGPMTATFLMPLALGACTALGGNIMSDAFGIVAMVAMTPLLTIQILGFYSIAKKKIARKQIQISMERVPDQVVYFD